MANPRSSLEISLDYIEDKLKLKIYPELKSQLYEIDEEEALKYGESRFQILENNNYEYELTNDKYFLKCANSGIVKASPRNINTGRISPNIYVGTLTLFITKLDNSDKEFPVYLEVLATKMNSEIDNSYRENYRFMLESITKKCTELLMQINSPVNQNFEIDFERDNKTIYQRFAFVYSLITSNEFSESIQKIIDSPTTKWSENMKSKDVRNLKKLNNSDIRQLVTNNNRFPLPEDHYMRIKYGLNTIPVKILSNHKIETVDTPENRFIKYVLQVFLKFCNDCNESFIERKYIRLQKESQVIINNLEKYLSHSFFKDISTPTTLKLNSPVLQRKSGYREILNYWLMYDLAAKLIWAGSEDFYDTGKRNIAILYEYWLFFTLYDLIKSKFNINSHSYDDKASEHLIVPTNDGLSIMVKSGKHTALEGIFDSGTRKFNIKFSYNRTFSGGKSYNSKLSGSWTKTLRPDYTLSIWPHDIDEKIAEEKELIVHIHFDSKYKIDKIAFIPNSNLNTTDQENSIEEEKTEERKGNYKNADLLKMHTYKDAIRRTGGAYVLYPGTENQEPLRGFHEILPGVGAFAIRPSEDNNGIKYLSEFIDKIINHFQDRTSQRENISYKSYNLHKESKADDNFLNELIPEYIGEHKVIPDETFIIIGYSEHIEWVLSKALFNFAIEAGNNSLSLGFKAINAKFLILYNQNEFITDKIFLLKETGPKIYSRQNLFDENYPITPTKDLYLVYEIEKDISQDFNQMKWDISKLNDYLNFYNSIVPITVTLKELINTRYLI